MVWVLLAVLTVVVLWRLRRRRQRRVARADHTATLRCLLVAPSDITRRDRPLGRRR